MGETPRLQPNVTHRAAQGAAWDGGGSANDAKHIPKERKELPGMATATTTDTAPCAMSVAIPSLSSSFKRPQAVLSATLLVFALVGQCDVDLDALGRFLRWYTTRFVDYYAPKIAYIDKTLRRVERHLPELSEDVYDAWDVSTALIVVVSLFHLMERLRVALLAKITSTKEQ